MICEKRLHFLQIGGLLTELNLVHTIHYMLPPFAKFSGPPPPPPPPAPQQCGVGEGGVGRPRSGRQIILSTYVPFCIIWDDSIKVIILPYANMNRRRSNHAIIGTFKAIVRPVGVRYVITCTDVHVHVYSGRLNFTCDVIYIDVQCICRWLASLHIIWNCGEGWESSSLPLFYSWEISVL